jgi:hypothetical protein
MMRFAVATIGLFVFVSSASAQIVYEPVKYQYTTGPYGYTFYYGGSDWRMLHFAKTDLNVNPHQVVTEGLRVYSDNVPRRNAAYFGYTAGDASNEANQNVPRYWRKSDLLRSGHVDCSGALVVPANAPCCGDGTIEIRPYMRPTTGPTMGRHPVIIIPKDLLDKPLHKPDDNGKKVASAQD